MANKFQDELQTVRKSDRTRAYNALAEDSLRSVEQMFGSFKVCDEALDLVPLVIDDQSDLADVLLSAPFDSSLDDEHDEATPWFTRCLNSAVRIRRAAA